MYIVEKTVIMRKMMKFDVRMTIRPSEGVWEQFLLLIMLIYDNTVVYISIKFNNLRDVSMTSANLILCT